MKRFRFAVIAVGCLLLLGVTGAFAAPKDITITYQGVLEEEGMPVTRADVAMDFFFHKDETTPLITWSESHTVDVVEGTFTVLLGSSNPFPEGLLADKGEIWLSIRVDGQPLLPRKPFTFTPYAAYSAHAELAAYATDADTVDGKDADELAEADHDHSSLEASDGTPAEALDIGASGHVSIGEDSTSSTKRLNVLGGSSDTYAAYIKTMDDVGDAFGVVGRAQGNGGNKHYGVYGFASSADAANYGVRGYALGSGSSVNYGIYGKAVGGAAKYAGYFEGDVGVTGLVNGRDVAADGAVLDSLETGGGSGDPTSDSWIGVDDVHTTSGDVSIGATTSKGNKLNVRSNTSGTASVYGYSDVGVPFSLLYASGTLNAYGVTGWPSDPVRIGVAGRITGLSDGPSVGVYGWTSDDAFQNYGMYALADGAAGGFGVNYGIYAKAVNAGYNYAGYFEGNVGVTGYLKVRGTGSGSGIRLGSDQDFAAIYHTADAVRIEGPNSRIQFGTSHYLEQLTSSEMCLASINTGKIKLGIGTRDPAESLHVAGNFLTVDGFGNEQAYLGGDNTADGVMLGSKNAAVSDVALKNRATLEYMDLHVGVLHIHGGADLAEPFAVEDPGDTVKPGLLMAIDPDRPGKLKVADQAYDRKVAGVVSGAGGIKPGMHMIQSDLADDDSVPVALTGRAYAWADAGNGPIEPGDLLTTSETPGHAMRVTDHERATGAVIGKAMTGLDDGTGLVLVLVNLQ